MLESYRFYVRIWQVPHVSLVNVRSGSSSVVAALRKLKRLCDRASSKAVSKDGRFVSPSKIRRMAKAAAEKRSRKNMLKKNALSDDSTPLRRRRRPSSAVKASEKETS